MPFTQPRVAFVTGCSGISGNAIVEYLIRQPKSEWSRIVVTSRSAPRNYWQDPRVEFVALDFLEPVETTIQKMFTYCRDVTHAFFTSYVHTDDFTRLAELNVPLFENFLTAIDTVAGGNLQRVCLQTGGKNYGVHLGPFPAPARETLPRYEDHGLNFYYTQEDFMFELHKQRSWSYNIIRPGGIIGFAPAKNGMSESITLALYMLISKELGEIPRFPGNKLFYNSCDDKSTAESIADMSVWAVTQEHTKNEAFNHANGDTFVWRYLWRNMGKYWGLDIPDQTTFPEINDDGKMANEFRMSEWAADKKPVWDRICDKYGGSKDAFGSGTWGYFDWAVGKTWPTTMSITKARKFGWNRYDDTEENYYETFRTFANAGVLPSRRAVLGANGDAGSAPVKAEANGPGHVDSVITNGANESQKVDMLERIDLKWAKEDHMSVTSHDSAIEVVS
ncbi:hypothetical protein CKM354_000629000 [Cercospora kikuchii]|uniref:PRISE-like Rossmann-fold domain-containing protein n=1 Tax=Cercospora kikuchii TaxID=84275 RepID=A0A9P3CHV0_9PEZI|nr:uncharacterized protein CKM354_000629000 [Cercospora kikuchii]GIZ43046.1 hypothetical protein CKM354_000629000 [Cercospora kikuchii]